MFTFFFWVTYAYTNITKSLQTRLAKKKKKVLTNQLERVSELSNSNKNKTSGGGSLYKIKSAT